MKQLGKAFGKEHSCSAVTVNDDKLGNIIVIQGDFCNKMKTYLIDTDLYKETDIKLHGIEDLSSKDNSKKLADDNIFISEEEEESQIILSDRYYELLDKLDINKQEVVRKIAYPKISFDAKNTKIDNFIKICHSIYVISDNVYKEIEDISATTDIYNTIINIKY